VTPEDYDCAVSTPLYPNWSFASSDAVPLTVRTNITQALLSIPVAHPASIIGQNRGWAAPISQFQVVKLFKALKLDIDYVPIYLRVWPWIKLNQKWGFGLLGLFIFATIYHLWLEYKFRQKSEHLINTERQLKNKALQLERIQSAAILGEIGAGLAHELNQPIAAITQYSEGGMMEQAKSIGEGSIQYQLLEKIHQQSIRAGEIVHRIRGLLQRNNAPSTEFYVHEQLMICLALLEHEFDTHNIKINTQVTTTEIKLQGDKVGFCQVLINVLKNAIDAVSEKEFSLNSCKRILIDLHLVDQSLQLKIYDNGIGLNCANEELKMTFLSTKVNGLGLGLSICNDVISQFGGQINLSKCKDDPNSPWQNGCRVLIVIPLNAMTD